MEMLEPRMLLTGAVNAALSFGGLDDDRITGIAVGSDHVVYVTGTFAGTVDMLPGAGTLNLVSTGGTDVFVAAYSFGSLQWARSFGGIGDDEGGDVVLAGDALWVIGSFRNSMDANPGTGTTTLVSTGAADAFLSRFTTTGGFVAGFSFGGTGDDFGDRITADDAGDLYLMGSFSGTADLNPGAGVTLRTANNPAGNLYVSKVATNGNLVWVNRYGYDDSLLPADIAVTPEGIPVLAGTFRGTMDIDGTEGGVSTLSSTRYLGFASVMTANGSLDFARTFGRPLAGDYDPIRVYDVDLDPAGNILLAGSFSGPIDIDPGAGTQTLTTLPELASATGADAFEGFILKLDANGDHVWSGALRGNGASDVWSITSDSGGGVYIAGDLQRSTDFDLSDDADFLSAPGASTRSLFVAKYSAAGELIWVTGASGATGRNDAVVLAVSPDFRPVVGGAFTNLLSLETTANGTLPVVGTTNLASNGQVDSFLLQFLPATIVPQIGLAASSTTVIRGEAITVTAAVAGPTDPTGTISFFDGTTLLGTVPLGDDNAASMPLTLLAVGAHSITARYSGDSTYEAKVSDPVVVTVVLPETPVGNIDYNANGLIVGWAADYQSLNTPVVVQIFINGGLRMALVANQERPDLQELLGSTKHGFTYQVPPLAAGTYTLTVVAFDPVSSAGVVVANTQVSSSSLYFDEAWYLRTYTDVAAAVTAGFLSSGYQHFVAAGAHEGRNASALFDEMWYRSKNPDVAAAIAAGALPSGWSHFTQAGTHEGRDPSRYFSESWYLRAYNDVKGAVNSGAIFSGFTHYLLAGMLENRMPTAWFDAAGYRTRNADVKAAIDAGQIRSTYEHFLASGMAELRTPGTWYSESAYRTRYADINSAVVAHTLPSGLYHFVNTGFDEGRNSSATFDSVAYVTKYPAAQTAINAGLAKSPFQYYLLYGRLLGQEP